MDISQIIEANQLFAVLNLKLYEFKYGKTTEGMQRLKLYHGVVDTIEDLSKNKIVDLDSVKMNLAVVVPVIPMEFLAKLAACLDGLKKKQTFDLEAYTAIVIYMVSLSAQVSKQVLMATSLFAMRSSKKSRLDQLESKPQVFACFKKILSLEKESSSRGRDSAFAKVYQQELRPILQNTDYFKPRIEYVENNEEIIEKTHLTNDRAYKCIKKIYDTWKKKHHDRVQKLLAFWDQNIWSVSLNPTEWVPKTIDPQKSIENLKKLLADIDDMLLSEK